MSEQPCHSLEVVLGAGHGLHARPATLLVEKARSYRSQVAIAAGGREADCKSILEVLSCGCTAGTTITVKACGPDSQEAVAALAELLGQL